MADFKPEKGDVVVAVDFGTTRTAVAYTIAGRTREMIKVLPLKKSGVLITGDPKTPTSLLMEGDKAIAFGYLAEQKFTGRRDNTVQWSLFKTFKMGLHNAQEPDPEVQSVENQGSLRLSRLLRESLNYVKENTIKHLQDTGVLISGNPDDVFWVLTVPAIWNDFSKSMMRKAAHQAGLIRHVNSDKLILALEPECAAVFSQKWGIGTKFMIADCGGGTLDITTHEVIQSSPLKLKEIFCPTGGSFGAKEVDEKFFEFMSSFLGKERYDKLKRDHSKEHFDLFSQWENKKMGFVFEDNEDDSTEISLSRIFEALELSKTNLLGMVKQWNSSHPQTTLECPNGPNNSIYLPLQLIRSFFTEIVEGIAREICRTRMDGLKYIVLAGGFSKCPLIYPEVVRAVREKNGRIEVIQAEEPDFCIVKGAAMFGIDPKECIKSRKSTFTIGIAAIRGFNPFSFRDWINCNEMTTSSDGKKRFFIFSEHIRAGDDVSPRNYHRQFYKPLTEDQRYIEIHVLKTEKHSVFLERAPGVRCLCKAEADLDDMMKLPFNDRGIWVEFSFGGAEMRCHVFDNENKKELSNIKVDFQFHQKSSLPCKANTRG